MFNIPSFFGFTAGSKVNYDPDALAFFGRVDAATGVTDFLTTTEKDAVNTLVLQMKTDLIWTAMKAIYPMVGGGTGTLAQKQAACSQNLASSSFTGSFTATGWTFASTGITSNGTAHMDTTLIPSTTLLLNDVHISGYIRTNTGGSGPFLSAEDAVTYNNALYIWPQFYSVRINDNSSTTGSPNVLGFHVGLRTASNVKQYRKNNTQMFQNTDASTGLNTSSIYVSKSRNNANFFQQEIAFISIGNSFSDLQSDNFYTAVQAFQTTLSRQV